MDLQELAILLLTGAVAGWLAAFILKKGRFSFLGNIIIGVVGACVGDRLFELLDVTIGEQWVGDLVSATIGAIILLLIAGLVIQKKK